MKPENEPSPSGGKRISFLMPYIDFCFMLIIIFVGMLSIAYFDPAGLTDMYVRADDQIDRSVGEYENEPRGVERRAHGTGGEASEGSARPLIGKDFKGGAVYPTPAPTPDASPELPTPDSVREPVPYNAPQTRNTAGSASQRELDAMRRRLEQLQSENRRLRNNRGGAAQQPRANGAGTRPATEPPHTNGAQNTTRPATDPAQGTQPQTPSAQNKGVSDHLYLDLGGSR